MRPTLFSRRVALALALAATGISAAGPARSADLVIGQLAPLSGVLASTGAQMVLGGRICFDSVNAAGGVHGAKIRVEVQDDRYEVAETLRLTQALVARPEVLALYGYAGSANVARLLQDKVLEQAGIALLAPYTGGELLRKPFNRWIFHLRAGYADEAEHIVKQLTTLGIERIALLYQNDAFGQSGMAGVQAALQRRNRQLLVAASYERNTGDVTDAVQRISAASPQAVVMIAVNKPAAAFARQYREAGGGGQLVNISVVDPAELVKLAGNKAVRGMGISQVVPSPFQPALPVVREFQQALSKYAPGQVPNYTNFEQYLGAKVLVEGLRRAGPNPSREKLITALETLRDFDLGGIRVSFAPNERVGSRYVEVTVIGGDGRLLK